jgi:hypothetical protein
VPGAFDRKAISLVSRESAREMRYGKVYYYDRMGNRVQQQNEMRLSELDKFTSPDFRSPLGNKKSIYGRKQLADLGEQVDHLVHVPDLHLRDPLETPPPLVDHNGDDLLMGHLIDHVPDRRYAVPDDLDEAVLNRPYFSDAGADLKLDDSTTDKRYEMIVSDKFEDDVYKREVKERVVEHRHGEDDQEDLCEQCKFEERQIELLHVEAGL